MSPPGWPWPARGLAGARAPGRRDESPAHQGDVHRHSRGRIVELRSVVEEHRHGAAGGGRIDAARRLAQHLEAIGAVERGQGLHEGGEGDARRRGGGRRPPDAPLRSRSLRSLPHEARLADANRPDDERGVPPGIPQRVAPDGPLTVPADEHAMPPDSLG